MAIVKVVQPAKRHDRYSVSYTFVLRTRLNKKKDTIPAHTVNIHRLRCKGKRNANSSAIGRNITMPHHGIFLSESTDGDKSSVISMAIPATSTRLVLKYQSSVRNRLRGELSCGIFSEGCRRKANRPLLVFAVEGLSSIVFMEMSCFVCRNRKCVK